MNIDVDRVVGFSMIALAIVALLFTSGCAVGSVDAHGRDVVAWDGFLWEPVPNAQPCDPATIKWEQVAAPLPGGEAAEVKDDDFSLCTIISIYSEAEAKQHRAAGPLSKYSASLYKHETDHLRTARRHPAGMTLAGWGDPNATSYGPPERDVRF